MKKIVNFIREFEIEIEDEMTDDGVIDLVRQMLQNDVELDFESFYFEVKDKESIGPIKIWRFDDIPKKYKISVGGDEDWVAVVPKEYIEKYKFLPIFLSAGRDFGVCNVIRIEVDGDRVLIGKHA